MTKQNKNITKALVLLRVDSKIENMIIDEIRQYDSVTEAHYIYGPYDMYIKVEVDDLDKLQNVVLNKIRNLYGVISTTTCYISD